MATGNKLKGITIEINGETGPLQTALKGVNKTSYDLQQELKQVNNQLKFDPGNTVLLAQQQELLASSITNTSAKLATLRIAEEQAQGQFERGEISAEQYRALTREVIKTEGQLRYLEEQASVTNDTFKNVAESAAKMGDKIIVAGVAGIGTALIGTTVAGVTMSDELQKALNGLQASTGITDKAMAGMEDTMLAIYNNNFGENFEEIGVAMAAVGKETGATGAELQKLTETAFLMRDTFGMEVADSVKAVTQLTKQFGIDGTEAYNLIAQGAQNGMNKNEDLLDIIQEYSVQFKGMGFSADEMFNMLSNGAKAGGFSIDVMGDAVKEFNIRSKDGSKASGDAFKSLGLDAKALTAAFGKGGDDGKKAFTTVSDALANCKDPMIQNQAGTALWGTMWEDLSSKAILALGNTEGEINSTKDALSGINNVKYNSFGEGIEGIKRQLITGIAIPIGQDILPKLNEFSTQLKEKIPSVIATLKPIMQSLIDKLVFLASNLNIILPVIAAVVAVLVGFSVVAKVATLISTISGVIAVLTTGAVAATPLIGGLAAMFTFITGPIGIAIAIIAALVIGFTLLWNHCEGFRTFWITLWDNIKLTTQTVADALVNFFTVTIPTAFNSFIALVTALPGQIGTFFTQIPTIVGDAITAALNTVIKWGTDLIAWVTTTIPTVITNILTFFDELPGKLGTALGNAVGSIIKFGVDLVAWVVLNIPIIIGKIVTFFTELPGKVATVFTNVLKSISTWGTNVTKWITTEVPKFILGIVNFYAELPGKIATVFVNVLTKIKGWGTNIKTWATTTLPGIITNIVSFFLGLPKKMLDIGVNIVKGLWNGISNTAGWLKNKVGDFVGGFVGGIKDKLGIQSPSKVMAQIGTYTVQGLAKGIENSKNLVTSAMKGLGSDMSIGMQLSPAMLGVGSLGSANNQTSQSTTQTLNNNNTITVPVYLDGKVIANVIAPYNDVIQGKSVTMNGRAVGV